MMQWVKNGILGVVVLAAAGIGLYLGLGMRERLHPLPVRNDPIPDNPFFVPGETIPNVPVMLSDSSVQTTHQLLSRGGVAIFMELGCPPCSVMAQRWTAALATWPDAPPVLGIAFASRDRIEEYRQRLAIGFPIACDTGDVFATSYQVLDYPMRVIVNRAGVIRSSTFDAREIVDSAYIRGLIASDSLPVNAP